MATFSSKLSSTPLLFIVIIAVILLCNFFILQISRRRENGMNTNDLEQAHSELESALLQRDVIVNLLNTRETRQRKKFKLGKDFIPIVLYVYKRAEYFSQVVDHLRNVTNIESTVLIISHDGVFPEMFDLVQSIDFATTIELVHPGFSEKISPTIKLKKHWWWLLSTVYDETPDLQDCDYFIFLEEDHIVSPDFYNTALAMREIYENKLPSNPELLGFALYNEQSKPISVPNGLRYMTKLVNTAYSYHRYTWNTIKHHKDLFFFCNDGWDHSMVFLMKMSAIPDTFIVPDLSRVKNIGKIGIHVKDEQHFKELGLDNVYISYDKNPTDWTTFHIMNQRDYEGYTPQVPNRYHSCYDKYIEAKKQGQV